MDVRRSINTSMWTDLWFDELEPVEKLLFIYLITNQKTNLLGIYDHTPRRISIDTRIPEKEVKEILEKFKKDGKIYFIDGWIWIVNWLKNQKWNPKMVRSAQIKFGNLEVSLKQGLEKLDSNSFNNLLKSMDRLSIEYKVPMDKYVKSKEGNNESLNNESLKKKGEKESKSHFDFTRSILILKSKEFFLELIEKGFNLKEFNSDLEMFLAQHDFTTCKTEKQLKNAFLKFQST